MQKSDRPYMPGYGIQPPTSEGPLLDWSFVDESMTQARNYWLVTVTPEGKPHAAPVWGLWYQDRFYFSTGTRSRKARNLEHNPEAVVHLESGEEAVILEGLVVVVPPGELFETLSKRYHRKYQIELDAENPVFEFTARKGFAWREKDFPTSSTRWVLEDSEK